MSILGTCKVNDVLGVCYGNEERERICRVLKIRDTDSEPLSRKSMARRPSVSRGRFLVTCQSTDGQVRSFYSDVERTARHIPRLRAAWLCLKRKLPKRAKVTA